MMKFNKSRIGKIMRELRECAKATGSMQSLIIENHTFSVGASGAYFYKNENYKGRYFYNHSNMIKFIDDIETYFEK